ncbi:MAG TPA: efflux RND transporter periplasmic adaptor subunit [Steroidobacteraceae bacterium]|jgi:multidrug efflux system membrane fusion protein|nr:efflux RND transporter periplasmic adaptor subunit [Steroidobacteraceae bacterium]
MTPDVLEPTADRQSTSVSDPQQQQASRRRRLAWIIGLAVLVVGMGWLIHHRIAAASKPQRSGRAAMMGGPMPVSVGKVGTADVPVVIEALGTVTPLATVQIRPQVTGPLIKIAFSEGQIIKAGELLAEIDPRPYQAALDSAQGQLEKDQAGLAGARIDLARYKRELQEDAVAAQTYTDQIATVHGDEAAVAADQASLETAKLNLSYTRMTSPVTGLVGLRDVDLGNLLQANQTQQVVTVTQMQPMSVLFSVPENDLTQVFQQLHQGGKLVAQAWDHDLQHLIATGTLSSVDNQINISTGTLNMRAMFDNKDLSLYPDQFVNIKLIVTTLKDQIVVPGSAVENGPSSNFVYIVNPDHTVTMRTVATGPTAGNNIAITKGLTAGETVVTDGADQLRDGQQVLLPGEKPAAELGAGGAHGGSTAERCARIAGMMKSATGTKAQRLAHMYSRLGCSAAQKPAAT